MNGETQTRLNWPRGLIRLYLVAWVVWGCYFLWYTTMELAAGPRSWKEITWAMAFVLNVAGLVPAFLLFAIRWIGKGFGRRKAELHQAWRSRKWGG